MKANWDLIRLVWWGLSLATAFAVVLLGIASFFTNVGEWLSVAILVQVVLYLPVGWSDIARCVHDPKPRPARRLLLARSPLLIFPLLLIALFGWGVWFAFGRVWFGVLAASCFGVPMFASMASLALMEPSRRKDRVFLACIVAMLAFPILTISATALVYGTQGR